MKIYAISLMSFFTGYMCFAMLQRNANKTKQINGPTLLRAFKNNQADDSIYVYSDGHLVTVRQNPSGRYFFIAYSWRTKNSKENGTGNISFACTKLWTRQKIDSTILANLPMKSECYQTPIYQSIYEFKNAKDYGDFYANTPDDIPLSHHTPCN